MRRIAEFFISGLPVFALLVLPILGMAKTLYPWLSEAEMQSSHLVQGHEAEAHQESGLHAAHSPLQDALEEAQEQEEAHLIHGKAPFLNQPFFLIRALVYVMVWGWLGRVFFRLSVKQDVTKKLEHTSLARKLSPIGLILFGLTLTFAGIDWVMSLDPMWYSTIWGVYLFGGSVVASLSVIILTALLIKQAGFVGGARPDGFQPVGSRTSDEMSPEVQQTHSLKKDEEYIHVEHFHDLGKLLFGFLVFWAYIAFSQFFLIWYANLPEEVSFFHRRYTDSEGWKWVSLALVFGHFVIPFVLLLSRNTKRYLHTLALAAIVILTMHIVEMYWVVMPNYSLTLSFHWMDMACTFAVGGIYLAVVLRKMTMHSLIPVGDPRLVRALHHETGG